MEPMSCECVGQRGAASSERVETAQCLQDGVHRSPGGGTAVGVAGPDRREYDPEECHECDEEDEQPDRSEGLAHRMHDRCGRLTAAVAIHGVLLSLT